MIKSNKGQGLGLISILVLFGLLYFIFTYNTKTYEFIVAAGDEQAHLVTSFTETGKAKDFAAYALRQATYEALWNSGMHACNFDGNVCTDNAKKETILNEIKSSFDSYIEIYSPTSALLSANFPDYKFDLSCPQNALSVTAYGFKEGCFLKSDFSYPRTPCEDLETKESCEKVKFSNGQSRACNWDVAQTPAACIDGLPEPNCESATDEQSCPTISAQWCQWQKSYSDDIHILSAPLIDYQFRIDSNAHFIETIDCNSYNAFVSAVHPAA